MDTHNQRTETYVADISGERADACGARLSATTRSVISNMIEEGNFLINGAVPKKSYKVKVGDVLVLNFQPEKLPDLTPKEIPFGLVLDRTDYAIIDKPAGITVHPAPGHYDDTLVNGLLYAFNITDDDNGFRPGIVHRLDKDTSGLLIVAKNSAARAALSKMFSDRLVSKKYLAICSGTPRFKEKQIDAPIGRDSFNRKKMAVKDGGRNALSIFRVKEIFKGAFLAEVEILTGRTHQIRVHAAYAGHPLVGDKLYGGKDLYNFNRQALHSHSLSFTDPFNGEEISVSSPMPQDMADLVKMFPPL